MRGTVQGVGFRPFVYKRASELGLRGFVLNDSAGVLIEAEGPSDNLARLCQIIADDPPPLAHVSSVDFSPVPMTGALGFHIVPTIEQGTPAVPVGVDTATCSDCLREVDDPADRRFEYPFTNCTNCGPRYTIVISVPYDRPATTMASFMMCPRCQAEYDDPSNRRFHAQPNSCPVCGPRLTYRLPDGTSVAGGRQALQRAKADLAAGKVVAVKGLGGYHLAADATNDSAVALLRSRKARDDKPFAVMVPSLEDGERLCELDQPAASALSSERRPIVLAPRRSPGGTRLAPGIAPGLNELGLMLPYTPLHHLLMKGLGWPIVMTSGNLSDEPIAHEDEDAIVRLGPLVDGLLTHDRRIHVRCEDSVVRRAGSKLQAVRRSRGYAPEPLPLPAPAHRQVLAVGAELKSTVSVAKESMLVASHHIGDLEHLATYKSFLQATSHLRHLFGVEAEVVAHDLHPEYLSTKFAEELGIDTWPVQHHHAHIAACLAEHGRMEHVLGIAFDGLGYGPDGVMWGGEWLIADFNGFERVGHLAEVVLPGGAAAIREPWRMAMSWLCAASGTSAAAGYGERTDGRWRPVLSVIEAGRGPRTTSAGRLFDAVAALLGIRRNVTYEGQAAIELEAVAAGVPEDQAPTYPLEPRSDGVLDPSPLIRSIFEDVVAGRSLAAIAAGFHVSFGRAAAALAVDLAHQRGLRTVALSGGVFQNVYLTRVLQAELTNAGLEVLVHERVPPNDGGISVGQAAIAALGDGGPA